MKKEEIDDIFNKLPKKPESKTDKILKKIPESKTPITKNDSKMDLESFSKSLTQTIPFTNAVLYDPIEKKVNETKFNETGSLFIKKILNSNELFNDKLESGNFLLEKFQKKLKLKTNKKEVSERAFGKKLEKQMKYFKIPSSYANYALYLPMNKIWRQYMNSILGNDKNDDIFFNKFLKADLHGAILKILCSKCKNYEGESGIIIQETMRSFKIITIDNKILTILKQNSIFLIEVLGKHLKIFGQHLCYRPSDRVKIKFKMKDTTKFVLDNNVLDEEKNS